MIAMSMMAVALYSFLQIMDNQNQGINILYSRLAETDILNSIKSYLIDETACKNTMTFKGNPPTNLAIKPFHSNSNRHRVHSIRNIHNKEVYVGGGVYSDRFLSILDMRINPNLTPQDLIDGPEESGIVNLEITFKRLKIPDSASISEVTRSISIFVKLDSDKRIIRCIQRRDLKLPSCTDREILTTDGTGQPFCTKITFPDVCKNKIVTVANDGTLECQEAVAPLLPICLPEDMLTSDSGGMPICATPPVPPDCSGSKVLTIQNGQYACIQPPANFCNKIIRVKRKWRKVQSGNHK